MHAFKTIAALLLLTAFSAMASGPANAKGPEAKPSELFELHVDPWVNLHHTLYHLARAKARDVKLRGRVQLDAEDLDADFGEHADAFAEALKAYRPLIDNHILLHDTMDTLRREIAQGPEAVTDPAIAKALKDAMPGYKAAIWARHKKRNDALAAKLKGELATHGIAMHEAYAQAMDSQWPKDPIRVDFVVYANRAGAYTGTEPNQIVMSSSDPDMSGDYSFEMLYHEAGHTKPLGWPARLMTAQAEEKVGFDTDRLWHSIIFYISGETTRNVLGDPEYKTYAEKNAMWGRGNLKGHLPALQQGWAEGHDLASRIEATVRALAAAQAASED